MVGDVVGVRVETDAGESRRILGTAYADGLPRVLRVDGFALDMVPEGPMVVIENDDRPGVIGDVGAAFGTAGVNIADMVISRESKKGGTADALMVLKTDGRPGDELLAALRGKPNVRSVRPVVLPPRGRERRTLVQISPCCVSTCRARRSRSTDRRAPSSTRRSRSGDSGTLAVTSGGRAANIAAKLDSGAMRVRP